jgi:hypothetical protein
MHGKDVLTVDDEKVGHVVGEEGDFLLVEHGLLKTKHAVPRTFLNDEGDHYRTTLSKQLIHDSPKLNGELDPQVVAEHYGLAEGYTDPITRGDEDVLEEDRIRDRVEVREGLTSGEGALDRGESPGITGGDRFRDSPNPPPSD